MRLFNWLRPKQKLSSRQEFIEGIFNNPTIPRPTKTRVAIDWTIQRIYNEFMDLSEEEEKEVVATIMVWLNTRFRYKVAPKIASNKQG